MTANAELLAGQVALVTAAGRGIGRACALALAAAGAKVIAVARTGEDLHSLARQSGGAVTTWQCDVTCDAFFNRLEALDALDIMVNNAGMNTPLAMASVDLQTLDQMLELNIRAVYRASQAAARAMLRRGRGGSIVHMSSQMGHVGAPHRTVYCMTKHAVEGLTKAMAVELGPKGIRVNAVAPTFIETALTRPMLADRDFAQSVLDGIPLGKIGQPEDVAAAVLFLASPGAALISGHSLRVDGGWTAR